MEQKSALIEQSEPDQVAMLLRAVVPFEFQALEPVERFDFLTRHIASARSYGIDTVQGQAMFCSLVLTNGAHFVDEPRWQTALAEVAAKRKTIFEVVDQATDDAAS